MYWKKASRHKPEANYSVFSEDTSLESKGIRNTKYTTASNHYAVYTLPQRQLLLKPRMDIGMGDAFCLLAR